MSPRRQTIVDDQGSKVPCDRCGSVRGIKLIKDRHNDKVFHTCSPCRKRLLPLGFELIQEVQ